MFDFPRWRAFVESKSTVLKASCGQVRFAAGDHAQKMILEIERNGVYGGFENWATGATDYTIVPMERTGSTTPLAHKWMLALTDETFEAVFDEFLREFDRFASASEISS